MLPLMGNQQADPQGERLGEVNARRGQGRIALIQGRHRTRTLRSKSCYSSAYL
jgi:hypothetical protein